MFLRINISISFEVAAWIISELGSDLLVLTRCTFSQFLYFQVSFLFYLVLLELDIGHFGLKEVRPPVFFVGSNAARVNVT